MSPALAEPWLFERLQAGLRIGHHDDRIDPGMLADWQALYGGRDPDAPGAPAPAGLATVLVMRAYLAVVNPRPPGNIHRLLSVRRVAPLPRGVALRTTVHCIGRELKGDRRLVRFGTACHALADGAPLLVAGELELLWAA